MVRALQIEGKLKISILKLLKILNAFFSKSLFSTRPETVLQQILTDRFEIWTEYSKQHSL